MGTPDTISADQFRAMMAKGQRGGRKNKYNAAPTLGVDLETYASKAEARRSAELVLLLRSGQLRQYAIQPRYELVPGFVYTADFEPTLANSDAHAEDIKGLRTDLFRRTCQMWRKHGKIPLWIMTLNKKGEWDVEIIPPAQNRQEDTRNARNQ